MQAGRSGEEAAPSTSNWGRHLPDEIRHAILRCLGHREWFRSRSVCSAWRPLHLSEKDFEVMMMGEFEAGPAFVQPFKGWKARWAAASAAEERMLTEPARITCSKLFLPPRQLACASFSLQQGIATLLTDRLGDAYVELLDVDTGCSVTTPNSAEGIISIAGHARSDGSFVVVDGYLSSWVQSLYFCVMEVPRSARSPTQGSSVGNATRTSKYPSSFTRTTSPCRGGEVSSTQTLTRD